MPQPNPNRTAIAEIISRLLSHFATADEPLAVRKAMAEDWLEDLVEFTPGQVKSASTEWRRAQSLRPTIAEIRKLATQAQRNDRERPALPSPTGNNELVMLKWEDCHTDDDKWEYYAQAYGWLIVRGYQPYDQRTARIDPKGQWWDTIRVNRWIDHIRDLDQRRADRHNATAERQAAIDAQEEKYARGAAWRAGKLDQYDAIHHPEKLRERQVAVAEAQVANAPPGSPIGQVLREMGVSAVEAQTASMPLEPGERSMSEAEKERVRRNSLAQARGEAAE